MPVHVCNVRNQLEERGLVEQSQKKPSGMTAPVPLSPLTGLQADAKTLHVNTISFSYWCSQVLSSWNPSQQVSPVKIGSRMSTGLL